LSPSLLGENIRTEQQKQDGGLKPPLTSTNARSVARGYNQLKVSGRCGYIWPSAPAHRLMVFSSSRPVAFK
jgi:hypothetical protein